MDSLDPFYSQLEKIWKVINEPFLQLSDSEISISSILMSILVILISIKIARLIGKILNQSLGARSVDSGVRDSIEKFVRYLIIAVGILFALDNMGVSVNSLAAIGAVLMVGIGFGLQNITQNFVSGIIILIERPIKVGDIVKVGTSSGRVVDIRVRSTVIRTRDDVTIIVPNSKLVSEEVINDSYSGQKIRQHIRVGVAYGSDIEKVKIVLRDSALKHAKVLKDPAPKIIFEDFGDSSLNFDLRFWCSDIWELDQISSDIRSEIDASFRNSGIEIPFPQRDLHIRSHFEKNKPEQ